MLLLKMGPEVHSRAQRALPALHRSEKEGGHRPPEFSHTIKIHIIYKVLNNYLTNDRIY